MVVARPRPGSRGDREAIHPPRATGQRLLAALTLGLFCRAMPVEQEKDIINPPSRQEHQLLSPSSRPRRPHFVSSGLRWLASSLLVAFLIVPTCRRRLRPDPGDGGVLSSYGRSKTAEVPDARPRVAVCFFGLTRSLRWTLPSVKNRLLGVLEKEDMRVDVFVHTYSLLEVNNERAHEVGLDYRSFVGDYKSLQPTRSLVSSQDDFDAIWPDPLSLTHYKWNYPTSLVGAVVRNVMRAYWSMSLSWGLLAEHAAEGGFEYDAVVLARPDVWFHHDVNISSEMFPLPERTAFIPSFGYDDLTAKKRNDRFAYGSMTTMRVVMNRIDTLFEPGAGSYGMGINSEWVFGHHLLKHEVSVHMLNLLVTRVRLTRDISIHDHGLVRRACKSGDDPIACTLMKAGFKFPADDGPL